MRKAQNDQIHAVDISTIQIEIFAKCLMTQSERISRISLLILLSMCTVRLNIDINPSAHLYLTYAPSSTNKAFVFAAVLEYALANFLSRQHKGMIEVSFLIRSGFCGPTYVKETSLTFLSQ